MFSDVFCIFLGQEMVKGRQRAYCFVWLLFTILLVQMYYFLATSCLLFHYTNLTVVRVCVCESGTSPEVDLTSNLRLAFP